MEKLRLIGNPPKTHSEQTAPDSRPVSPQTRMAKKAALLLFGLLPPLDVGDSELFIASTIAILAEFPGDVMFAAVDPVQGIPSRSDRPTLRLIKQVCEEFYLPIAREEEREKARKDMELARKDRRPPRTTEQQARIDAQVERVRRELGIVADGLPRSMQRRILIDRNPSPYLRADLEARKTRNEARRAIEQDRGAE